MTPLIKISINQKLLYILKYKKQKSKYEQAIIFLRFWIGPSLHNLI